MADALEDVHPAPAASSPEEARTRKRSRREVLAVGRAIQTSKARNARRANENQRLTALRQQRRMKSLDRALQAVRL